VVNLSSVDLRISFFPIDGIFSLVMLLFLPSPNTSSCGLMLFFPSFGWTQCRESRKHHQAKSSTHQ